MSHMNHKWIRSPSHLHTMVNSTHAYANTQHPRNPQNNVIFEAQSRNKCSNLHISQFNGSLPWLSRRSSECVDIRIRLIECSGELNCAVLIWHQWFGLHSFISLRQGNTHGYISNFVCHSPFP